MNTTNSADSNKLDRRSRCPRCWQPQFSCFCEAFKPQRLPFQLLVLIHPIERKRRLASGRLLHALVEPSVCIEGEDFVQHAGLQRLLDDPSLKPYVLSPGPGSVDLDQLNSDQRREVLQNEDQRRLLLILIDGTWATARRMLRSPQLRDLPRLMFTPRQTSRFIVRKQPAPTCLSTLEATAEFIERFTVGPAESQECGPHQNSQVIADTLRSAFSELIRAHLAQDPSLTYTRAKAPEASIEQV
jgi:DTW domain-containing protein YfiP